MTSLKKEMIAMILAGGQGSRLKDLTLDIAKPAVPFGGRYRIIDFALSNCANSDIDTVGILTQYEPYILNTHIGIGIPWDLDRLNGGVRILPPYINRKGGRWYKGTANAIYENINFIDKYNPEYLLILSGDHIYNMNYWDMLKFHKASKSKLTIAVKPVNIKEASRFGLVVTDEKSKIVGFEEKPENPTTTLASMGIYIFNWKILRRALIEDEENTNSDNDFGKNIIPKLLNEGLNLFAYEFDDYWKDVGTVESLWEANMNLLSGDDKIELYDPKWKIYSKNMISSPQYISKDANVESSLVTDGCVIEGNIKKSIISTKARIGKGSNIIESVIMPNVVVEDNVYLYKTIVMNDVIVKKGTKVEGTTENIVIVKNSEESEG